MTPDAVMRELAGLHALARSLVHGDADADDLIQDTAIAAMEHPPDDDRPLRPWLATVLRNRWRMDRRGRSRRLAREEAVGLSIEEGTTAPDAIDRARTLERLASALVALDEPFRDVVIRRYLDGKSAAEIARALGVPAGTVRWRLKTGLERLRAELDRSTPRWQRALVPLTVVKGAVVMKAKHSVLALLLLLLFAGGAAVLFFVFRGSDDKQSGQSASTTAKGSAADRTAPQLLVRDAGSATATPPPAGQGRVTVEPVALEGGVISGRVINWSTGEGVDGAELTFTAGGRITTVRADKHGSFELAPPAPGRFSLATIIAPGFLPYAPELEHSPVRLSLAPKQAVRGVTLFLFPALEYTGTVVDAKNAPVAGAKVRLADPPSGEQTLEKIVTEWTTDKQGQFKFNAPDESVFEASRGKQRGWALLDGPVMTTHRMTIMIGDAPARDASIRGKTVDAQGQPLPDVVVVAMPQGPQGPQPGPPHAKKAPPAPRAVAYATSGPDGTFSLDNLDRDKYMLVAELDNHAQARKPDVIGGTHGVTITLDDGLPIGGTVRNASDEPVAAFTLLVTQRRGVVREVVMTRSVIDARGRFEVRVAKGDYELLVSANGWAPSAPLPVAAGTTDAKISLSAGATLVGVVTDAVKGEPVEYARVTREGAGGGASAQPANAGTVTRSDGTFELTGIPAGPFTISIGAGNFHPRLEGGLVATDGGRVGPLKVALQPLAEGEEPKIELVGIGVKLAGDGDALRVDMVAPKSGAEDAGIVAGDHVIAVDNIPVTTLGIDGAVARIRGVAHTKVAVTIKRGDQTLPLSVERKPLRF